MNEKSFYTIIVVITLFLLGILSGIKIAPTTDITWSFCRTVPAQEPNGSINITYRCHKDSTFIMLKDVPPLAQPGQESQQLPQIFPPRRGDG